MNEMSKKKIPYPINEELEAYLAQYEREAPIPVLYEDLLRWSYTMPLLDKENDDTLWQTAFYEERERIELHNGLRKIYSILSSNGDYHLIKHLRIDRIDYCTFGNTKPFRIRIINNFNDNYDYYYVKRADASRVYGLELEHMLSPNRIEYLYHKDTLIEMHIAGIPGDIFLKNYKNYHFTNEVRLAKEFIKFNERCFVMLLGDMRAYNFVVDITQDFDDIQYRIRAIDFDQHCYEGRKSIYLPQFFKENLEYVNLASKHINEETIIQYQQEERALIAKRMKAERFRLRDLVSILIKEELSPPDKFNQLKSELTVHYEDEVFNDSKTSGELLWNSLDQVLKKNVIHLFAKSKE